MSRYFRHEEQLMRSIAFLILTAMLTIGMLSAQEDADTKPRKSNPGLGDFAPSEVVEADTALAFPTDI